LKFRAVDIALQPFFDRLKSALLEEGFLSVPFSDGFRED